MKSLAQLLFPIIELNSHDEHDMITTVEYEVCNIVSLD